MNISKILAISLIFLLPLQSVEVLSDVHFDKDDGPSTFYLDADQNNPVTDNAQVDHDAKHAGGCFHSHFHSFFGSALLLTNIYVRQNTLIALPIDKYLPVDTSTLFRPPISI